jgi:hypothetical protein
MRNFAKLRIIRPDLGHFYRFLANLTTLRVIYDLIQAISANFYTFTNLKVHLRPFLGHLTYF